MSHEEFTDEVYKLTGCDRYDTPQDVLCLIKEKFTKEEKNENEKL